MRESDIKKGREGRRDGLGRWSKRKRSAEREKGRLRGQVRDN